MKTAIRIDSHQHFWQYNKQEFDWLDVSMAPLQRDFLPTDLKPSLETQKMDGCVAVQARQTYEETLWLLSLADQYPWIKGVVGWIDLRANDLADQLNELEKYTALKGFRHVLQGEAEPEFMLAKDFLAGLQMIAERGYCYDILVTQDQLPEVIKLVNRLPIMPLVIDHLAKPLIKEGRHSMSGKTAWHDWCHHMDSLSQLEHVHCKLSGMVTEADWQSWTAEQLFPYFEKVIDCFGPERVMFGSDWPVCQVAASYQQVVSLTECALEALCPESKNQIMGSNASKFYSL